MTRSPSLGSSPLEFRVALLTHPHVLEFAGEPKALLVVGPAGRPVRNESGDQLPGDLAQIQIAEVRDEMATQRGLVPVERTLADVALDVVAEPLNPKSANRIFVGWRNAPCLTFTFD
jgi:hypothetical protein